jgi:O-antigen/teichoic acid export membrane protein
MVVGSVPRGMATDNLDSLATSPAPASRRMPLPEGTLPVGAALLVAGFATYAFFRVGRNALGGEEEFAPISALWFATFSLAPGVFLPLEQELGRALSHRTARGEGGRPVVQRVRLLAGGLAGIVLLAIVLASPLITSVYFDGDWIMVAALATAFIAYAPAHLSRGICSGTGRFHSYAIIMGSDGVIRILLCLLLAAIGVTAAGPYGFAVALAPLFAVGALALRGNLRTEPGPPAEWHEVTANLGWLLGGSIFAAALLNAGVVAANLLAAENEKFLVTQFAYGVLLARVPLFMFQAVQAALLPRLAGLAARNELDEFVAGFRRLAILVIGVGVVGTAGAFVLGPWAIRLVYDAELNGRTLAMLALSSAVYMMALATAQAVIALRGHAMVAAGWSLGFFVFIVGTWISSDQLFRRIEIGLLASSIAAMTFFAVALRARLRAGMTVDADSFRDAITDMPLES